MHPLFEPRVSDPQKLPLSCTGLGSALNRVGILTRETCFSAESEYRWSLDPASSSVPSGGFKAYHLPSGQWMQVIASVFSKYQSWVSDVEKWWLEINLWPKIDKPARSKLMRHILRRLRGVWKHLVWLLPSLVLCTGWAATWWWAWQGSLRLFQARRGSDGAGHVAFQSSYGQAYGKHYTCLHGRHYWFSLCRRWSKTQGKDSFPKLIQLVRQSLSLCSTLCICIRITQ